ncbi:MAG: SulP family inorganic anion transporter [Bacteroidota bacterium]
MKNLFKTWKQDLPAGFVVFFVALPLCLGIGLSSTSVAGHEEFSNIFSGIIAGVIGGVVVGFFSGSRLGVSGPAAGLITIVSAALLTLGSYESFLLAVIISGAIQFIAGMVGAGVIGNYFPSSVIKGMLAGIGITLILKEIPHALGYDKDFFGDENFFQPDGHNTISELFYAFNAFELGAIIISIVSMTILILFEKPFLKKYSVFKILPGSIFVVVIGIALNELFKLISPDIYVNSKHLVALPVASSISEFLTFFKTPDFSEILNPKVYQIAITLALVGSLETLLSVEATDKLDPEHYITPTNRELRAQGIGNMFSGLIGGLPITQVIVRSSANINSGAKSKLSAIFHGIVLFVFVALIPQILNKIPLASLAAILFMVGYKLANIKLFKRMYSLGLNQFLPFIVTILGILFFNLLFGIALGIVVSIFYILKRNFHNDFKKIENENGLTIVLSEEVSFLNKGGILNAISSLKNNGSVTIDGSKCKSIDYDVLEELHEFITKNAPVKSIKVELVNIPELSNFSNLK